MSRPDHSMPTDLTPHRRHKPMPRWLTLWPYAAWVLLCVAIWFLHKNSSVFGGMTGVVESIAEPVAPLETARLLSIEVTTGDHVQKGDVIAKLDMSMLDARMALDQARMMEAESTITGYQQSILQLVRQFDNAIRDAESQLALERLRIARDQAEYNELKKELVRRESLLEKKLLDEESVSQLRPTVAALKQTLDASPAILDALEQRAADSRAQREEVNQWLRIEGDDDISAAILKKMEARNAIITASQEQAELRRSFYVLRATRDGIVSRVFHQPGDVVQAGDPIARIVVSTSSTVVGFLPENMLADVTEGQEVHVYRPTGKAKKHIAKVASIGPEVLQLPGRLSPISGNPLRGRRILFELQEPTDLIPGETVNIRRIVNARLFGN